MSMLSAQCDELRAMAESVGLAVPQAATLMMEAADTIDSLDLALDSKRIAERRVTELLDENAKLCELVEDMLDCIDIQIAFERVPARWMQDEFAGRARELGMEVDG